MLKIILLYNWYRIQNFIHTIYDLSHGDAMKKLLDNACG